MQKKMVFDQPGRADAKIINSGTISVNENGLAALVAPTVRNDGVIAGKLAKVALASGNSTYKLDMYGDDLITFTVSENDVDTLHAADGPPLASAEVKNTGSIKTDGGLVVMTAAQLDGIVGAVVNSGDIEAGEVSFTGKGSHVSVSNTGRIDASSSISDGGRVRMDSDATLSASGSIKATGAKKGGHIALTAEDIKVAANTSIDASGSTGGGTVLIGGNWQGKGPERNAKTTTVEKNTSIRADAMSKGDGGTVVVWSDNKTVFDGQISAQGGALGGNGGEVETSGKSLKLGDNTFVTTVAANGLYGKWLIDPLVFTIAESGGDRTGADISQYLDNNGNLVISATNVINVYDNISWSSDSTLELNAAITNINSTISSSGKNATLKFLGEIYMEDRGGKITLTGENATLIADGNTYSLIKTLNDLRSISTGTTSSDYFALACDIDASSTLSSSELPFYPIGYTGFGGIFNGLGNKIININISRPSENKYIGLFSRLLSGGSVSNLFVENINIQAGSFSDYIGGITGYNEGEINNCHIDGGCISGDYNVGGLVGKNDSKISNSSSTAEVCEYFVGTNVMNIGGLVGYNNSYIMDSYSTGLVYASNGEYVGGLCGNNWGYIGSSYSTGDVVGYGATGGFVGHLGTSASIVDSYSVGRVSSDIAGGSDNGAFVGWSKGGNIKSSYYNSDTSNLNNIHSGVTGLSTSKMKNRDSFSGWDFTHTWGIQNGLSYPYLIGVSQPINNSPGSSGESSSSSNTNQQIQNENIIIAQIDKSIQHDQENSTNGDAIIRDPWISTEVNGYNDYLSYLKDDTYIEVVKIQESVDSTINADVQINQEMPADIESLQASLEGYLQDTVTFEDALRNLLPNYFIRKANEQIQIANGHLKKASLAYTGEMAEAMESLVNARIYAIVAEAVANKNTEKVEQISELPPLVESLYWSGEVEKGLGKNAMQAVNVDSTQTIAASTYDASKPGDEGVTTEQKVMESLNKTLDTVFTTLWKSTEMLQGAEGDSIKSRTTTSMADALKNDEMLQRYIDLYNFYIQEKMSFAGILLG